MVDLPRYVRARPKPNGRTFYYYERHRGTPRAWPRLSLPFHPQAPEFWLRCRQCERLDANRNDDGTWAWAWLSDTGRRYVLPDPKGDAGIDAFWKAIDKAEAADAGYLAGVNKTFRALIEQYKEHADYLKLSASAKGDYDRYLNVVLKAWGDDPVNELTAEIAQAAIDTYQNAPASGRYFRSVLSKLVAFGIPRGYSDSNPVEHTENINYDKQPYKPWPDWAFELFFEFARVSLHLPVYSALYTGQRKVDVVPMLRPKREDTVIELVARKTKANVWVPIHSEYRQVIDATRLVGADGIPQIEHSRLHLTEEGEPWSYEGFATAWQRDMTFTVDEAKAEASGLDLAWLREKEAAMKRLRAEGLVFHGLRKNAVNMLLEVGCTEAEVAAIVEMSEQMVRHYSKDVNKRRLAVNAMKKLEAGWADTRKQLFGGTVHRLVKNS